MNKPFSQACENNKGPILAVLKQYFAQTKSVLEIGTGTGQHAVYMMRGQRVNMMGFLVPILHTSCKSMKLN